jgi:hypothetical protein
MHFGIIAVEAEVAQLVEAFAHCWPKHQPLASRSLAGLEALHAWMRAAQREGAAGAGPSGHHGVDTFGFWQDGQWAVMLDPGYAQASDPRALAALSERFGTALSFVIETSGGCAFFDAYRQGQRLRRIQSIDGEVTAAGARLPEEAALAASTYYMDETEQLQLAFGLTPPGRLPADLPVTGAAYLDRADYVVQEAKPRGPCAGASPSQPRRPWWRFW